MSNIPPAPEKPDPAAPAPAVPPTPTEPTISAVAFRTALITTWLPPEGPKGLGTLTVEPRTTAYHYQQYRQGPPPEIGSVIFMSAGWLNAEAPGTRTSLGQWLMRGTFTYANDTINLSDAMISGNVQLFRAGGFSVGPSGTYELNRTVAQWDPVVAGEPWFAQIQLQTDPASNTVFRLCFHVRIPGVIRLSCGKFDRLTGEHRGVHIVDDSFGMGALTWETR